MTQTKPETLPIADREPHVKLEMMSQPRYLSGARDMVAAIARRLGFHDSECGQIALAVDEALCNVIRHGYDRAPDKPIWLSIWPYEIGGETRGIQIIIEDVILKLATDLRQTEIGGPDQWQSGLAGEESAGRTFCATRGDPGHSGCGSSRQQFRVCPGRP